MTRTPWWALSAVLSLALAAAGARAQCSGHSCPYGSCSSSCTAPTGDCTENEEAAKEDEAANEDEAAKNEDAAEDEAKCPCDKCECKDGKCDCKKCKCANCPCAKAQAKCDGGKCKCGCEKCECGKAASKCECCGKSCCCCTKGKADANGKDEEKASGESECISIVLEDLTINYFGAGVTIKKIKVRCKCQGVELGDVAKDLSSIGRAPAPYYSAPCSCVPVYPVPAPARR